MLVQGVVPNDWREANITALFKKGSKSASQYYRPVSLTSVIYKLMKSIIKDEIIKHLSIFKGKTYSLGIPLNYYSSGI